MKEFGVFPDGRKVFEYTIENESGMKMSVINLGGIITKLFVPDKTGTPVNVVLGYNDLVGYLLDTSYIGSLIGRCANRIQDASCIIDGNEYQLSANLAPNHSLHGGMKGFNTVFWEIEKVQSEDGESLILQYLSPAGDDGYPGTMQINVIYTLTRDNKFIIDYSAITDAPTIANFTQHSYFNLSGIACANALDHLLTVRADEFLPVHPDGIPTGEILSVSGTALDLHNEKSVQDIVTSGDVYVETAKGLDHCFVFKKENSDELIEMATLRSPESGIYVKVASTQPALQCYSGNSLDKPFMKHQGICLETQGYTNAINEARFPTVMLFPHQPYEERTVFEFGNM